MELKDRVEQVAMTLLDQLGDSVELDDLCRVWALNRSKLTEKTDMVELEVNDPGRYSLYWAEYSTAQSIVVSRLLQLTLNAHLGPYYMK